MQCQCISKIVIYNTGVQCNPVYVLCQYKKGGWLQCIAHWRGDLKNVARDAQRYLQKGTWTGKSKNSVWISSIFRTMWVQFQVSFSAIYGCKRRAIIRWPTYAALLWQKEASDKSDISCKLAKCVCHFHWRQWNIMMSYSYIPYLLAGWVFMHKIWPGRRAH